jgi:heme A synthase
MGHSRLPCRRYTLGRVCPLHWLRCRMWKSLAVVRRRHFSPSDPDFDRIHPPYEQWGGLGKRGVLVGLDATRNATEAPFSLGRNCRIVLIVKEALLGAFLVLFGHLAQDKSIARVVSLSLHSVNTMLLQGAINITAFWIGKPSFNMLHWPATGRALIPAFALTMLLAGATGTVTALGNTLFPAASLGSSFAQDFSSESHYLLRLRILHPAAAMITTVLIARCLAGIWRSQNKSLRSLAMVTSLIFLFQLALGVFNVVLLAPMWLQIIHLLTADVLWITLVLLATSGSPLKALVDARCQRAVSCTPG